MADRGDGLEVRVARLDERPLVAGVLAYAFRDDPIVEWLCPDRSRRADLFRLLVEHHHAAPGCADVALWEGDVVGAALWDPPGHRPSALAQLRSVPRSVLALRWGTWRGLALESSFARHAPRQPYWYLAELGAALPGRGIGGALLAHRLATLTGPAYLESSNEANLPLYSRHGFVARDPDRLPRGGPEYWPMDRPGKSALS